MSDRDPNPNVFASTGLKPVVSSAFFYPFAYFAAGNLMNMISHVQNFGAEIGARIAEHGPAITHLADIAIKSMLQ